MLYLEAVQSLKNGLNKSTITKHDLHCHGHESQRENVICAMEHGSEIDQIQTKKVKIAVFLFIFGLDLREHHGRREKEGGKPHEGHTPPKTRLWTPFVWYVFHPLLGSLLCFSCAKLHSWAGQKLFSRVSEICREGASSGMFSSPIRFRTVSEYCSVRVSRFGLSTK